MIANAATLLAQSGVMVLIGIAGHGSPVDLGLVGNALIRSNAAIVGTVNAGRRHYPGAVDVLRRVDPDWLGRLITRRVPLESWPTALERTDDDVKIAVDFRRLNRRSARGSPLDRVCAANPAGRGRGDRMSDHRSSVPSSYAPDNRTPAQIEKDLAATRGRLGDTIDTLVDTVSPKRIVERRVASVRESFTLPDGSLDVKKLIPIAAAVVGVVAGLVGLRLIVRGRDE